MEGNEMTDLKGEITKHAANGGEIPSKSQGTSNAESPDQLNTIYVKDVCDLCESGAAIATCINCEEYLCVQCKVSHERSKASKSHKIVPKENAFKSQVGRSGNEPSLEDLFCLDHDDKNIVVFCKTCKKCACEVCRSVHTTHDTVPIDTALPILQLMCLENAKALHQPIKFITDNRQVVETECENSTVMQKQLLDKLEARRSKLKLYISEASSNCRGQINETVEGDISKGKTIQEDVAKSLQIGETLLKQMGSLSYSSDIFSIIMGLRDFEGAFDTVSKIQGAVHSQVSQWKRITFVSDGELDAMDDILSRIDRLFEVQLETDTKEIPDITVEYFRTSAPDSTRPKSSANLNKIPKARSMSNLHDSDVPDGNPNAGIAVIKDADSKWTKVNIDYVEVQVNRVQSRKLNFDKILGHRSYDKQLITIRSIRNNPNKGEVSLYCMKKQEDSSSIYPYVSKAISIATSYDVMPVCPNMYAVLEENYITLRDIELSPITMTPRTNDGFYIECMAVYSSSQLVTFERASFGPTRVAFLSSKDLSMVNSIDIPECDKIAPAFNPVFHMFTTANGDVLILMRLGIVTFLVVRKDGTVLKYSNERFLNKFLACTANTLCVDDLGTLWMGTSQGDIVRMDLSGASKVVHHFSGPILGMALGEMSDRLFVSHFSVSASGSLISEFRLKYFRQFKH